MKKKKRERRVYSIEEVWNLCSRIRLKIRWCSSLKYGFDMTRELGKETPPDEPIQIEVDGIKRDVTAHVREFLNAAVTEEHASDFRDGITRMDVVNIPTDISQTTPIRFELEARGVLDRKRNKEHL